MILKKIRVDRNQIINYLIDRMYYIIEQVKYIKKDRDKK